jgi:hypothetical protein
MAMNWKLAMDVLCVIEDAALILLIVKDLRGQR